MNEEGIERKRRKEETRKKKVYKIAKGNKRVKKEN